MGLPSTAEIKHELRLLMAAETLAASLARAPEAAIELKISALELLLSVPDIHVTPSPAMGMEMLTRGLREQQLANLKVEAGA